MELDTQVVELLGRHRLMGELLEDGLEVAVPARDRGIDLIAYADLSRQVAVFAARPIQMKASTDSGFSVARKYTRIADLILAYVWHLGGARPAVTYALPYGAAVEVAEAMEWTTTAAWREGGVYTTTTPTRKLLGLLEPHRMGPGKWWTLVAGSPAGPDKAASDEEQSPSWRMILNDALTPADVPASAAGWNEISAFALSYYIHTQDGKLRGAYPGEEPSPEADLDQLRGWLLAQQRAIRAGYMGDPDDDPVLLAPLRRVIEAIRQRVGGPR